MGMISIPLKKVKAEFNVFYNIGELYKMYSSVLYHLLYDSIKYSLFPFKPIDLLGIKEYDTIIPIHDTNTEKTICIIASCSPAPTSVQEPEGKQT